MGDGAGGCAPVKGRGKNPAKGFGNTFLLALGIFIGLAAIFEGVARTNLVDRWFPYKSLGNSHYQFEIKWYRLQQYIARQGGVDVIILGSSLVNTGFDPVVVSDVYYDKTGIRLRFFNFGVEGLTVAPNSITAKLLVEKYHPALLIFVTEMRDYRAGNGMEYQERFLSDPWMRYEMGDFNLAGWFIDHSAALQHYLPYRNWIRSDFPLTFSLFINRYHDTTADGYEPSNVVGKNVDQPPDPANPEDKAYLDEYLHFQVDPSRVANLRAILDLAWRGETQIIVMEMPVHPSFFYFVGGESVHQEFQREIAATVQARGGIFLPMSYDLAIPLEGRINRWHLNQKGAPVLSAYLGDQLANLTNQSGKTFINNHHENSR